jgi:hypothetical protein
MISTDSAVFKNELTSARVFEALEERGGFFGFGNFDWMDYREGGGAGVMNVRFKGSHF